MNEYTIVVDLFSPVASRSSWRTILQTNQANTNEAEYFIRNSDDRLGYAGITYSTNSMDDTRWTRLVVSFDVGSAITSYLDGSLLHVHSGVINSIDGAYSLDPTVLFFADQDGDNAPLNVGALAIYDGILTPSEVSALGVAGAAIPEPSVTLLGLAALGALAGRRRNA